MHFRERVKYQNHQKLFKKGLNWVSRAVLSPDKDNVGIFKIVILKHMKKG